jgi:hypothetical protein
MTDCWTLKVHPKVDYIDKHFGSTEGNEKVKIRGRGLKKKNADTLAFVGGQECSLKKVKNRKIVCRTAKVTELPPL